MNPLILLAKSAIENYIKKEKIIEPPGDFPEEFLKRQAGIFVTIEKNNELRGCIGTYLPTRANVAEEIIHNAISAATKDYRFEPVQEKEFNDLSYAVYILNPPELVKDLRDFDPKKYGIIVKSQGFISSSDVIFNPSAQVYQKSGLLLPDLDGVDTVKQQISICCQKGGIDPKKEKIIIYRFTVEKYQ